MPLHYRDTKGTIIKIMDINTFSREEIVAIDRISKNGELHAMDKVEIVGLTSEKGRHLNGRIAIVNGIDSDEKNDGNSNPYLAKQEDGRYKVTVEFDETKGKEIRPGVNKSTGKLKSYSLKRENLVMHDIGPGTIARDPVGKEILRRHGLDVTSTAEREAADPETAGFFPAILQGDVVRAREILEVMKRRGDPTPAISILDATGDAALSGGINYGHADIVKLLLEYGGNPNQVCNIPMMRDANMTYFHMAIMMFDMIDEDGGSAEEIVNALLEGGGDVHTMSPGRGTPLSSAVNIKTNHAARMRIAKKILNKGADPNQIIAIDGPRNESLALFRACVEASGPEYSDEDRLEMVQLLVDHGADPGKFISLEARQESCNAIHCVVSRKKNDVLRVLLSCEKGRAAVNAKRVEKSPRVDGQNNGDGETALIMTVSCDSLERNKEARDMAVQLLKARADVDITDSMGVNARIWMMDRNPDPERPHAKKKELDELYEKSEKIGDPSFWESEEVKAFIEEGDNDFVKCDNCGRWSDEIFQTGSMSKFQRCARCKNVYCKCSSVKCSTMLVIYYIHMV